MDQAVSLKRKRRRRTLACEECRRRKVRCDRELPCANCVQAYKPEHCFYQPDPMGARSPPPPLTHPSGQQQQQHPHPSHPADAGSSGLDALSGAAVGMAGGGTLESEWPPPPKTTSTGPSPARYFGLSAPADGTNSHNHGRHPHPYENSSQGYPSPATDPRAGGGYPGNGNENENENGSCNALLPQDLATSATGSAEMTSLKDQVRQLQTQLATVLSAQGPSQAGRSQTTQNAHNAQPTVLPPLSPHPPPAHLLINGYRPGRPQERNPEAAGEDRHRGKTRYISQGHWMNGALLTLMKPLLGEIMGRRETRHSEIYRNMKKCKSLGRAIKASRTPPLQRALDVGRYMPTRELADELVTAYFRTFEAVYRILHIPTFTEAYQRYWENPSAANSVFVVQMQLCMAIGVCFYDDTYSLRHLATQWLYEAQVWMMAPSQSEKSRMTVAGLQVMCLLHLAREITGVGGDLSWISAGGLVRSAMYMGLHRDPIRTPKVPRFLTEIRRRLWATILELALQSSLDSGGPPLISLADYDTLPPANFFDDQLVEKSTSGSAALPPPKPLTTFTNTSIQIALFKSFPTRLAVARHINDFRSTDSYDDALRLNSELRAVCHTLSATLQSFCPAANTGKMRPSTFHLRFVEHLSQRCFLTLNQAFLAASQNDPKYYFSRKVSVDTALKLFQGWATTSPVGTGGSTAGPATGATPPTSSHWNTVVTSNGASAGSGAGASMSASPGSSSRGARGHSFLATPAGEMIDEPDDFRRLSISATAGFRSVPVQCIATVSMELLWQLEEEHSVRLSLGLGSGRGASAAPSSVNTTDSDAAAILAMPGVVPQSVLLTSVEQAVRFGEQRLMAGETNVKGYLFPCAVLAQARALMRGADKEDMEKAVMADCGARLKHSVELLHDVAARSSGGTGTGEDDAATSLSLGSVGATPDLSQGMASFDMGALADANIPIGGDDWVWEDLMHDQGFNFSFNMNNIDPFFPTI